MPSFLYPKCIQLFLILFRSNPFFVLCAFPWKAFSLSVSVSKCGTQMKCDKWGKVWTIINLSPPCHCGYLSMQPKVELDFRQTYYIIYMWWVHDWQKTFGPLKLMLILATLHLLSWFRNHCNIFLNNFIYLLFLAVLGLRCCEGFLRLLGAGATL